MVEPLVDQLKSLFFTGFFGSLLMFCLYSFYMGSVTVLRPLLRNSDAMVFAALVSAAHIVVYLVCNVPLAIFDYYGYFQEYKLFRKESMKPTRQLVQKTVIEAAISLFVSTPVLSYFAFPTYVYFGLTPLDSPLPTLMDIVQTMFIGHIFNDVAFYFAHRMFHSKALYWIHKQHHNYTGTMGISAEFANPIEGLLANLIPTIGGVVLFGCHHPLCFIVWLAMRLQQTFLAHSGFCFKDTWLDFFGLAHADGAIFHDHHHTSNCGNFGSYYMDYLFGTMDNFVAGGSFQGYLNKKDKKKETSPASVSSLCNQG